MRRSRCSTILSRFLSLRPRRSTFDLSSSNVSEMSLSTTSCGELIRSSKAFRFRSSSRSLEPCFTSLARAFVRGKTSSTISVSILVSSMSLISSISFRAFVLRPFSLDSSTFRSDWAFVAKSRRSTSFFSESCSFFFSSPIWRTLSTTSSPSLLEALISISSLWRLSTVSFSSTSRWLVLFRSDFSFSAWSGKRAAT